MDDHPPYPREAAEAEASRPAGSHQEQLKYRAAEGLPRYNPVKGKPLSPEEFAREEASGASDSFRKFGIVVSAAIGVWCVYLTGAWVISSRPWGAIYPAIFGAFLLWSAYGSWRYGPANTRPQGWAFEIFGIVAAIGIATLWIIAEKTGDDVYRDQAQGLSFFGGLIVAGSLVSAAMWIHPTTRARMRAVKRGELDQYLSGRRRD